MTDRRFKNPDKPFDFAAVLRDPAFDGDATLGAGGFFDNESRAWIAVGSLLDDLGAAAGSTYDRLLGHFAKRGITPIMVGRMNAFELEAALRAELDNQGKSPAAGDSAAGVDKGPVPPNLFRWPDREEATLQPTPWRLVDYLWRHPGRTAKILKAAQVVWGSEASEGAVKGAINSANASLVEKSIPVTLSQKSGHFSLSIDG